MLFTLQEQLNKLQPHDAVFFREAEDVLGVLLLEGDWEATEEIVARRIRLPVGEEEGGV